MSTILLTGRNGFIGQELITLIKKNHKIISVIRRKKDDIDYKLEELIITDLCQISLSHVKNLNIDLIIHLASQVRGKPKDKFKNNIESTKRISSIASYLNVPIILSSTTNVFFVDILGTYTKSKKICEEIIRTNNPSHIIIRVPLVVGSNSLSMRTVKDFYRKYYFFPLFGKQEGKTQPIHVSSLIDLIVMLVKDSKYNAREINLIGKHVYNYRTIIKNIISMEKNIFFFKIPFLIIYYITRSFESIGVPFFVSCEELISINTDKIIEENKITNTVIVDNTEKNLFK